MIRTVADLIKEFIVAEYKILSEENIKHPPTIGNMYEGLTESLLNTAIDSSIDLNVPRDGFINGCDYDNLISVKHN